MAQDFGNRFTGEMPMAGEVKFAVNPGPPAVEVGIEPLGAVLSVRFDGETIKVSAIGMVQYGPDGRTASGSIDLPEDTPHMKALVDAVTTLYGRYGRAAQSRAYEHAAEALGVARRTGELESNSGN